GVEPAGKALDADCALPAAAGRLDKLDPPFLAPGAEGRADLPGRGVGLEVPVAGVAAGEPDLVERAEGAVDLAAQVVAGLAQMDRHRPLLRRHAEELRERHAVGRARPARRDAEVAPGADIADPAAVFLQVDAAV